MDPIPDNFPQSPTGNDDEESDDDDEWNDLMNDTNCF